MIKKCFFIFIICFASFCGNQKTCVATELEFFDIFKTVKTDYGSRVGGDFLITEDGSILFFYATDEGIVIYESNDVGTTWSEPKILLHNPMAPAKGRYMLPSVLRLKTGDILLAYIYIVPGLPYYAHSYYRRSSDEGKTWSDQFCLTPHPGYFLVHNDRLVQLSCGRVIAIGAYKARWPDSNDHSGYVASCFYSDDDGYIWQMSKNTVDMLEQGVEVQEADIVELKSGRLFMFARSYSGHPVRAYSSDKGTTWSSGELIKDLEMEHASYPTVRKIPTTGDLLCIWGAKATLQESGPPRRSSLTVAISKDEGKTFEHVRHIIDDPNDDFGYQAIEFLNNGTTLIAFHHREGMKLVRIPADWFYGKKSTF